jgi:hypothetical protein
VVLPGAAGGRAGGGVAGAQPISLFGGQDSVQGISFLTAAGSVAIAAGQRCQMTISYVSQ